MSLLRLFFLINIAIACLPLFRPTDNCEDIPLTPAQRNMLGLPPMSRPATPQEEKQYLTPPRYSRSTTPTGRSISGTPRSASGSPYSPAIRNSGGGSPHSGAMSGFKGSGNESGRRRTSGSPLALGGNDMDGPFGSSMTPTKSGKASVGLNSKWLYEKGRRSSGGLAGFGGGGSVFM